MSTHKPTYTSTCVAGSPPSPAPLPLETAAQRTWRRLRLPVTLVAAVAVSFALSACAGRSAYFAPPADAATAELNAANRAASLAAALPMPGAASYDTRYFSWEDSARHRTVAAKLYLPLQTLSTSRENAATAPLVVFSHGLGGSREGYSYLGKYWASKGYASLHLQHVGSDRSIWGGNPVAVLMRLQAAAQDSEAIARVHDFSFALDQLLASDVAGRIDAQRIVAAGHSYGANTVLLAAGAQVSRNVNGAMQTMDYRDPRIQAAVIISAPPFYGEADIRSILSPIHIPTLHITSTGDEITVPGYHSLPQDRLAVFEATGGRFKTLAVFKDGSHSMFTDRLNTGGEVLNPKVKAATRELSIAFFQRVFDKTTQPLALWAIANAPLVARFDERQ